MGVDWITWVRFQLEKECSLRHHVHNDSVTHPTSCYIISGSRSLENKNNPLRADVWNAWILITMPLYATLNIVTVVGDIHFDWSESLCLHCSFLLPEVL
jgi:hypothetical protein